MLALYLTLDINTTSLFLIKSAPFDKREEAIRRDKKWLLVIVIT